MENSSIVLGIVITVIILVPTFYLATAGRRKMKKNLTRFIDTLKEQAIYVNDYEQLGQYIIGVDGNAGILVYKNGENEPEIVDLKNLSVCSNNIPKELKKNLNNNLYLELLTKDAKKSKIALEFYDSTFALDPSNEIKLIENWTGKVNSYISRA
ncbi:MAG: hypothetical protein LBQ22_09290 [Bacteroidales bacterium]|jgi:hypothetical protein|nr:hypothetical protein [Bacteroidales bacterium]